MLPASNHHIYCINLILHVSNMLSANSFDVRKILSASHSIFSLAATPLSISYS
jgi:hypothetical protein